MSIRTRVATAALGASVAIASVVVSFYEGRENDAYLDVAGVPTICDGHTSGVKLGQTLSDAECDDLLKHDLGVAFAAVDQHVKVELSVERRAALASFVFNVGAGKFRQSTLLRKLNAGDTAGACAELSRWVYAAGEVQEGLVKRRQSERELCEVGLDSSTVISRAD